MKKTYGIEFPFRDSEYGSYLRMTESIQKEIRSNLIHLILTKKGSRYYLPDFGTRIYEYIFAQNNVITFGRLEQEIREAVKKYIPNLEITKIDILSAEEQYEEMNTMLEENRTKVYNYSGSLPHTAIIKIEYLVNNGTFTSSDFIIINIS